jgi:small subunit ribosomal protein S10
MQKAKINLASPDIDRLNSMTDSIIEIAKRTKTKVSGPIPLPTKKMKITTRRTPDGEGKASWEKYEMRVHKRLIELGVDERALRHIMRVQIPEGVNIEIELLE